MVKKVHQNFAYARAKEADRVADKSEDALVSKDAGLRHSANVAHMITRRAKSVNMCNYDYNGICMAPGMCRDACRGSRCANYDDRKPKKNPSHDPPRWRVRLRRLRKSEAGRKKGKRRPCSQTTHKRGRTSCADTGLKCNRSSCRGND